MKKLLTVSDLSVNYGELNIVKDVSFDLCEGEWLMLIGPNGAGKTTIIKAISNSVKYDGTVSYLGQDIKTLKPTDLARFIGVLDQNHSAGYAFTVGEIVSLGRYAYSKGFLNGHDKDGASMISKALRVTGMSDFVNKPCTELSGGEVQRMYLAQVLAQNPKILLLDEPTNHLDLIYQKQFFDIITEWVKEEEGRGVISVVHDLSLAKAFGSDAILLDKGGVISQGPAEEVFTKENLMSAYSMDVYAWMKEMLSNW